MRQQGQLQFGGDWTAEKLERVRKYLCAYTVALKKQHFQLTYIDAFAGTGYRRLEKDEKSILPILPEMAENETQKFLKGSAHIALDIEPQFSEYIFIEKDSENLAELEKLKAKFPEKSDRIKLVNADANSYIKQLCKSSWAGRRAVLFLDPYGMQVRWSTIQAIAQTKAIDLWYLFPLGIAVNRLLRRDGIINEGERRKLDDIFGTTDWFDAFYTIKKERNLFGEISSVEKVGTFDSISHYLIDRLKAEFVGVADNPLLLRNKTNVPIFSLSFAALNEKGAPIALKIAQHILRG